MIAGADSGGIYCISHAVSTRGADITASFRSDRVSELDVDAVSAKVSGVLY